MEEPQSRPLITGLAPPPSGAPRMSLTRVKIVKVHFTFYLTFQNVYFEHVIFFFITSIKS